MTCYITILLLHEKSVCFQIKPGEMREHKNLFDTGDSYWGGEGEREGERERTDSDTTYL